MDFTTVDDVFATLAARGRTPDGYAVVELPGMSASAAVDPWGQRHILFPVATDRPVVPDTKSIGVQLVARGLLVDGELRQFVDLACLDASLNSLFTAVALEALTAAADTSDPDVRAAAVLDRWRDLFKSQPAAGISQSERMGLFGELSLLEELVRRSPGAIKTWGGPSKARHDFVSDQLDIEVKATIERQATSIQIHGLEQLSSSGTERLSLFVYVVERVPAGGDRLADIVDRILKAGVEPPALYDKLNAVSIGPADLDRDDVRLRTTARRAYIVGADFPRLTADAMVTWPVAGIVAVQYVVDLRDEVPMASDETEAMLDSFVRAQTP